MPSGNRRKDGSQGKAPFPARGFSQYSHPGTSGGRRDDLSTVAIDGPAAAGKGTIGRAIAARFGFRHLDTGLLYRAVGVKGGDPAQAAWDISPEDLARDDLRTLEAGQAASRVAALPEVRAALVDFQRRFKSKGARCWTGVISAR